MCVSPYLFYCQLFRVYALMSVSEWVSESEWTSANWRVRGFEIYIGYVIILTCVNSCKKDLWNKLLIAKKNKERKKKTIQSVKFIGKNLWTKIPTSLLKYNKIKEKNKINSKKQTQQIHSVHDDDEKKTTKIPAADKLTDLNRKRQTRVVLYESKWKGAKNRN